MPQFESGTASWRRAAGGAASLFLAVALLSSFAAATFSPDAQPTGWVSRPALSSYDLRSGHEVTYRSDYKAGLWTGAVRAYTINASGDVQTTGPWTTPDTATALGAVSWDTGRRIVTRTGSGTAVPFRWSSLDTTQQAALGTATTGPQMLNFLRGDRSNETPSGTKLRARATVQGDIQHSTLVYWKHSTGEKRLYVGGNDGMLHAFDATNGSEVWAYVPSMLVSRLPLLGANPYTHSLYVDGGLAVADVLIGSGASATTKTFLAGALGGGGKGLFMVDVSSPTPATEAAAAANLKWELTPTSTGFGNLGYTYAQPRFARLNNGSAALVVGNGYGNSGNGHATLLIINADTGALIREIDTGSGSTGSPNGLSTATLVDSNNDGKADCAYAGDIDGNLWRFDLKSGSASSWSATRLLTTSPAQAITVEPVVANHPNGGRLVLFGTGRMLSAADATDTSAFYAYGYWDGAPAANTTWLDQTLTEVASGSARLRTLTSQVPNWSSGGHQGWRLALPGGERVLGDGPFISDERYYFTSTNPSVAAASSNQAAGANWLMEVSALTGGAPSGPIFDLTADGKIDSADLVGSAVVVGKYLGEGVASQAVLADQANLGQTLFNRQSDFDFSPPSTSSSGGPGVSGGHFDVDSYDTTLTTKNGATTGSFAHVKHTHQYDDKYNVTGVNFLNASDASFNLGTMLSNSNNFKVLVMNQYLSPASMLSLGGGAFTSVKTFNNLASATDAATLLAGLASYKLNSVTSLAWKVPLDAFAPKDWWGDGGPARAGLIPTQTGCVNSVGSDGSSSPLGPNGERHNGALTVQLIDAATPASALELNYPAGGPKYGWRVKAALFTTYVLAEYTTFWHHPNGKCYGATGWVANPPQDAPGNGSTTTPAAGSSDPRDGIFAMTPTGVTVSSTATTVVGDVTTTTVTYSDGKKLTIVVTSGASGSETVVTTDRAGAVTNGTRMSAGTLTQAPDETLQVSRRINWREVVRP